MIRKFCSVIMFILFAGTSINAQFMLEDAYPNLTFSNPVFLTHADDNANRVFVIEQAGRIKVFPNSQSVSSAKEFLNITDRVTSGGEMGLLGLAFHPDYQNNGYLYVNYTSNNPLRTIIARYQVTSNPDSADKNSELQLLVFDQPLGNHNGGWIGFGPNDGYLYIGTGDGGSFGDPQNNAQNITNLLGKILRIDIDGGTPYAIPTTNPFFDSTGNVAREIYAWGLRNPWRCSFDPVTGQLWAGDVGQNAWEEIDIIENGKNYGWRCYEGNHTYNTSGCNYPEYVFPIWEYDHGMGFSITGGYFYRGTNVPELYEKYIYADYVTRKIWALTYDGITPPSNELLLTAASNPTSFGVDQFNELYIIGFNPDRIYRFTPSTFQLSVSIADGWNMVSVPGTNPAGMGVTDWWSGKDPAADVFKYSAGYLPVTTTAPTEGYWMKNSGAQIYSYPAIEIVTHTDISAALGWNMIGGYENTVPVGALFTTPPGLIAGTIFEYSGGYLPATDIVPGYGYWVKMSAAGLIGGLGVPPLGKRSVEAVEYIQDDWGKIIITDNTGISYTLYAVKGEVDLNQYELPPAPPSGMFDIRYSSGRIAEDIISSIQTIQMSSLEYPITVQAEGMDIRVQDESGKDINENVKSGDQITISSSQINKLMVTGELIPDVYALEQNYPNPFNPSTTIKFAVSQESNVNLSIYNVLGELVSTLVNEQKKPGYYEYEFNASNLASGVYLYRIVSGDFVETKKMVLLR